MIIIERTTCQNRIVFVNIQAEANKIQVWQSKSLFKSVFLSYNYIQQIWGPFSNLQTLLRSLFLFYEDLNSGPLHFEHLRRVLLQSVFQRRDVSANLSIKAKDSLFPSWNWRLGYKSLLRKCMEQLWWNLRNFY